MVCEISTPLEGAGALTGRPGQGQCDGFMLIGSGLLAFWLDDRDALDYLRGTGNAALVRHVRPDQTCIWSFYDRGAFWFVVWHGAPGDTGWSLFRSSGLTAADAREAITDLLNTGATDGC